MVYPKAAVYLNDFLDSWVAQEDKDFEFLLINDGVAQLEKKCADLKLKTRVLAASGSPTALRKKAIAWALEAGFETVIFADADDTFDKTRVAVSKAVVRESGLVFNELTLFGDRIQGQMPLFEGRLKEGAQIAENDVLDANCLGLSNSAVSAKLLAGVFEMAPDDILVYDWALFSRVLHRGAKATFTGKTRTHYRRYEGNLAGLPPLADEDILRGVRVKAEHYASLTSLGPEYSSRAREFKALDTKLASDSVFKQRYCSAVKTVPPKNNWWWETIKKEGELGS